MSPEIDALDHDSGHGEQASDQRIRLAGDGEHGPVMVAIGGNVEEPDAGGVTQGRRDGLQGSWIAPLTDVGHALEQGH
jgi:hypothetical protein